MWLGPCPFPFRGAIGLVSDGNDMDEGYERGDMRGGEGGMGRFGSALARDKGDTEPLVLNDVRVDNVVVDSVERAERLVALGDDDASARESLIGNADELELELALNSAGVELEPEGGIGVAVVRVGREIELALFR